MIDDLCETCGIGYILPSGVCDHCDTRQQKSARPISLEKPLQDGVVLAWNRQSRVWEPKLWVHSEQGWYSMPIDRGGIWTHWMLMPIAP